MSDDSPQAIPQAYLYIMAGIVIGAFMTFVVIQSTPATFGLEHACEGVCI